MGYNAKYMETVENKTEQTKKPVDQLAEEIVTLQEQRDKMKADGVSETDIIFSLVQKEINAKFEQIEKLRENDVETAPQEVTPEVAAAEKIAHSYAHAKEDIAELLKYRDALPTDDASSMALRVEVGKLIEQKKKELGGDGSVEFKQAA